MRAYLEFQFEQGQLAALARNILPYVVICTLALAGNAFAAPSCNPQPSDAEKLHRAVAFFLVQRSTLEPFAIVDGGLQRVDGGLWSNPEAAMAAQPGCCNIAYEDAETYRASEIRARLGADFGGFAYIAFRYLRSEDGKPPMIYRAFESYALDTCGNPVTIMSDD